jgi:protein-disulfide isomerase
LATDSQTPLAVLNGKNITESDLATFDRGQITRMNNQIYLTRKQTLDAFLSEQLLTQEAQKRGLTREQLIQQEVVSKVQAPSDAEVEQWYNANKSRLGNKPLAELKEQISSQLKSQKQQQQQQEFIRSLRKTADLKILLKPPVVPLTLDGSPSRGPANAPVTIVEFSDYQ